MIAGGFIVGGSNAASIMEMAHKCTAKKMDMHRASGVYKFKVKIPVQGEESARTFLNNRYVALAEVDDWDSMRRTISIVRGRAVDE